MYELNLSNYKFPSLGGLYNTEGSSFHLIEVLYNVSNIYIYIKNKILFLLIHFWLFKTCCTVETRITWNCIVFMQVLFLQVFL